MRSDRTRTGAAGTGSLPLTPRDRHSVKEGDCDRLVLVAEFHAGRFCKDGEAAADGAGEADRTEGAGDWERDRDLNHESCESIEGALPRRTGAGDGVRRGFGFGPINPDVVFGLLLKSSKRGTAGLKASSTE